MLTGPRAFSVMQTGRATYSVKHIVETSDRVIGYLKVVKAEWWKAKTRNETGDRGTE